MKPTSHVTYRSRLSKVFRLPDAIVCRVFERREDQIRLHLGAPIESCPCFKCGGAPKRCWSADGWDMTRPGAPTLDVPSMWLDQVAASSDVDAALFDLYGKQRLDEAIPRRVMLRARAAEAGFEGDNQIELINKYVCVELKKRGISWSPK